MKPETTTGQFSTVLDSQLQTWSAEPLRQVASLEEPEEHGDRQLARIRRIGRRLFQVAECVVCFNRAEDNEYESSAGWTTVEEVFCASLPTPSALVVVPDMRLHKKMKRHRMVADEPHMRFYASYPIRSRDSTAIGSISLVDYFPRQLTAEEGESLVDLARLVEAEMRARSVSAAQQELRRKNRHLRRKSLIDPLLNIWNRGAILRILTIEAIRCDKAGEPLSLIVIDLDHFKKINDTYGHTTGDAALVRVAGLLRSCIREREALGRYGGEEFLVVLPGVSQEAAMTVAERMRAAVAASSEQVGNAALSFSISAGVASTEVFATATTEAMISYADFALYQAKDAGRNCVKPALACAL
ncbi:MAG: sensor diguanylate cyclase [Paucimonas sp.]|jgi:diguanylate cyclase (GGDEF)-like protein|nr:sensor diguanylate cyclase [Paucimonas sp.]